MPENPPILFLDFDGVLNHLDRPHFPGSRENFSREAVQALREILQATRAEIVVSSSWREDLRADIPRVWIMNGLGKFLSRIRDFTPILTDESPSARRPREIAAWLDENPRYYHRFLILDDEPMPSPWRSRHIRTDPSIGLTRPHAQQAIRLLANPSTP